MAEKHLNAAGTHVWLSNAETGGVWECPPDYVPVALQRGWEYAEPYDDSLDALFDDTTPELEQTGFDPSEHDVKAVSDHLALHAASSPGEVVRVLELERAGKNRKSVVVPDGFDPITGE